MRRQSLRRKSDGIANLPRSSLGIGNAEVKNGFTKKQKLFGLGAFLGVVLVGGYYLNKAKSKFDKFSEKAKLLSGKKFFKIDEDGIHFSIYPIIDNTGSDFQVEIQRPKVFLRVNGVEFETEDRQDSVLIAKRSQSELGGFHINVGWSKLGATIKQIALKILPNLFSIIAMIGEYSAKFKQLKTDINALDKDKDLNFVQIHQRITEIKIESSKLAIPGPNGMPIISDPQKLAALKTEKDALEKRLQLGEQKMKLANELATESLAMLKKVGVEVEYAVTFNVKGIPMPKKYAKLTVL